MSIQCRINVIGRSKCPSPRGKQKTMVSEVVITIANADIEGDPTIQFSKITFYIRTMTYDKINNIQVTITIHSIIPIM